MTTETETTDGDEVRRAIKDLTEAGLLTRRQAEAWVLRDVEGLPRDETAHHMEISRTVLDKHLRAARDKVGDARATAEVVTAIKAEARQPSANPRYRVRVTGQAELVAPVNDGTGDGPETESVELDDEETTVDGWPTIRSDGPVVAEVERIEDGGSA